MPKEKHKKTAKKKKTTTNTGRVVSASVKKDISNAVDSIPGLMVSHTPWNAMNNDAESGQPIQPATSNVRGYVPPRHSKTLLWAGVSVIGLAILIMWGWNIRAMMHDVATQPSQEKAMLATAGQDFGDILNYMKDQEAKSSLLPTANAATTKESIKTALTALLATVATSTTSTATTSEISNF